MGNSDTLGAAGGDEMARLCHDLRQYVSAARLIARAPGDDELDAQVRGRFVMISRVLGQASDILTAAAGDGDLRTKSAELGRVVDECVEIVRVNRGVPVEVHGCASTIVHGDPAMLRRALVNVLDNATRATKGEGHVVVNVGDDEAGAWVEVVDRGTGFGQVPRGSGHGLGTVSSAVRASGGRLQISTGPGPGTTVRLSLPRQRRRLQEEA